MAYNVKDVFYLSTEATITAATANAGSAQLDLSAYIDPIARGRSKGTGLAVYKVDWVLQDNVDSDIMKVNEVGAFSYGLLAGVGFGDNATGALNATEATFSATNALCIESGAYYGMASTTATLASTPGPTDLSTKWMSTSTEVPYIIVRDNVCLVYNVATNMTNDCILGCRLSVAQISLDQSTLNQLLRTQTV
tara:strand:- start:8 stop:586 length:579 start_codon:yes stop_codon:yes gene_type:complete